MFPTESMSSKSGIGRIEGSSTDGCSLRVCSPWMRIFLSSEISASGFDDRLTCIASDMPGLPYFPAIALISYMLYTVVSIANWSSAVIIP